MSQVIPLSDYKASRGQAIASGLAHEPDQEGPDQARRLAFEDSIYAHGKTTRLSVRVPDIRCAACSLKIEKQLSAMPDVERVATNLSDKRVVVDFSRGSGFGFIDAIEKLGFTVLPDRLNLAQVALEQERKSMLARLGVAGIGMMQVMMYALTGYLAGDSGIEPAYEALMRWASLGVATLVAFYSATPFHLGALRDLRNRNLGMDVPVSLAILAAWTLSMIHTLTQSGEVYFDSVCMFTFLLLIGRFIELGSREKYQHSQNLNDSLLPTSAQLTSGEYIAIRSIPVGAELQVPAGQRIPADGTIISGDSSVDEAAFTGESVPLRKRAGMQVLAGSVNLDQPLVIRADKVWDDYVITRISDLFRESSLYKPAFSVLADRIARYFVAIILLMASASAGYWYLQGDAAWFSIALSVLVVSCPCALSLATPVAYTVAIAALRNAGVVVSNGAFLERLNDTNAVVFDKTGTLTTGKLTVSGVKILDSAFGEQDVLEIASVLEQGYAHPIARALTTHSGRICSDRHMEPGAGVSGEVDGVVFRLGKADFVCGIAETAPDKNGIWIMLGYHRPVAWIQFADQVRPESGTVLNTLRKAGYRLSMLTGDGAHEGRRIAADLGLDDVTAGVTPDQKVQQLINRQASGDRVLMVGDGINDAAAMGVAQASVAVSPVDVFVQQAADATLLTDNLQTLNTLLVFSRKVNRVIRQNIGWAVAYNMTVIPLAITGQIVPWVAALGMSASSLLVVANANRLYKVAD
ncbi:MAG: cadmium-translocating P-type ATPase [Pseudomonadales bacterium]|nr:cadmium-translocating P-type ATPase [Pseudomonadales bacterium]